MSIVAEHGSEVTRGAADLRRLAVAWQHPDGRAINPIGLLTFDGSRYRFTYIRNARSVADFPRLLGFPDLDRSYEAPRLFPLFAQRVMDAGRPDYSRYLESLGLDPVTATPWEQISRSGGRRRGDTLQLFPVPEVADGHVDCTFLVHGLRYIPDDTRVLGGRPVTVSEQEHEQALSSLERDSLLQLLPEPGNARNPEAIIVATPTGVPLGYVPDLLVHDLQTLPLEAVKVSVLRINPVGAPMHTRLLARLQAVASEAVTFFADERWAPLSA